MLISVWMPHNSSRPKFYLSTAGPISRFLLQELNNSLLLKFTMSNLMSLIKCGNQTMTCML